MTAEIRGVVPYGGQETQFSLQAQPSLIMPNDKVAQPETDASFNALEDYFIPAGWVAMVGDLTPDGLQKYRAPDGSVHVYVPAERPVAASPVIAPDLYRHDDGIAESTAQATNSPQSLDGTSEFRFVQHGDGTVDVSARFKNGDERMAGFLYAAAVSPTSDMSFATSPAYAYPLIQQSLEQQPQLAAIASSVVVEDQPNSLADELFVAPVDSVEDAARRTKLWSRLAKIAAVAITAYGMQKAYGFSSGGENFFTLDPSYPTRLLEKPVGDIVSMYNFVTFPSQIFSKLFGKD